MKNQLFLICFGVLLSTACRQQNTLILKRSHSVLVDEGERPISASTEFIRPVNDSLMLIGSRFDYSLYNYQTGKLYKDSLLSQIDKKTVIRDLLRRQYPSYSFFEETAMYEAGSAIADSNFFYIGYILVCQIENSQKKNQLRHSEAFFILLKYAPDGSFVKGFLEENASIFENKPDCKASMIANFSIQGTEIYTSRSIYNGEIKPQRSFLNQYAFQDTYFKYRDSLPLFYPANVDTYYVFNPAFTQYEGEGYAGDSKSIYNLKTGERVFDNLLTNPDKETLSNIGFAKQKERKYLVYTSDLLDITLTHAPDITAYIYDCEAKELVSKEQFPAPGKGVFLANIYRGKLFVLSPENENYLIQVYEIGK